MDKKINKKMKSKFEIHITENDEAIRIQLKGKGEKLLEGLRRLIVSLLDSGASVEMIMSEVTKAIENSSSNTKVIKTDKKGLEQAIQTSNILAKEEIDLIYQLFMMIVLLKEILECKLNSYLQGKLLYGMP